MYFYFIVSFKINNISNENKRLRRNINSTGNSTDNNALKYQAYKGVLPVSSQNTSFDNDNFNNSNETSSEDYNTTTSDYGNDTISIIILEDYDSILSPFLGILPVGFDYP
uniref:ATS domain-containing protein n=1 Tax=Parastrongyloides trichosuri TaxID=131310 RepID=A0A0N4ZBU1_PARTI